MVLPRGYVNKEQLASAVEQAKRKLGPEVVHLKHSLGDDTSGEPSIYFRIVLTDSASREETLGEITGNIGEILFDELRPIENWDLTPWQFVRNHKIAQDYLVSLLIKQRRTP